MCCERFSISRERDNSADALPRSISPPPGPSAQELYGPLLRKIEALDQELADAHFRTFVDSDDAGAQGTIHNLDT